jgi:hypothetical protein
MYVFPLVCFKHHGQVLLKFQFFWIKFIMISKIKLKSFQINLMLELLCEIIRFTFKILFIRSNNFFFLLNL